MNSMFFSISSLLFISLLAFIYFSKGKIDSLEIKTYTIILIVCFFIVLVELLCFPAASLHDRFPLLSNIVLKLYLALIVLWITIFTLYILIISNKDYESNEKKFNIFISKTKKILNIAFLIILILIIVLPMNVKYEPAAIYTYGAAVDLVFITTGLSIMISMFTLFKNWSNIKGRRYLPAFMFIIVSFIAFIIQKIEPSLILTGLIQTFITCLMYFTIENPDVILLNQTILAKDQADKANLAKSDFLSSMSHEIRTPLNAIKAFSEFTYTTDDIVEAKANAKEVLKAVDILLELINGVLDISKIESGNIEMKNVDYNPIILFNDTAKLVNVRIKEKDIDFKLNIAKDLPTTLYGDKSRIQQILMNLLTNAAKYTTKGSIKFNVQCINKDNICTMIIAVEDTGRGIKPEEINKLFKKFNRLEEDLNTTSEGTGLGLAITKQLIEIMGGKVTVQSIYGSGSKFTVKISQVIKDPNPNITELFKPDQNVPRVSTETVLETYDDDTLILHTQPIQYTNFSGKKVLVVDDNNVNLKVVTRYLKPYNITTTECNTAFEVLDRIKNNEEFDLLLVDDMMPKMSGTELMTYLKKDGYSVPIVVITANAKVGDREKYLEEGFDEFIDKPINRERFDIIINDFLS